MRSPFNIKNATANRKRFLKTMFEFMFAQMTKAKMQFCNGFDSSMIFTIKNIIGGWPDKFQDIVLKNTTKASDFPNVMVKTVLCIYLFKVDKKR